MQDFARALSKCVERAEQRHKDAHACVETSQIKKTEAKSVEPNKVTVGSITTAQLEEIAQVKLPDLNTNKIESAMRIVAGTARNMGIKIET